MPRPPRLQDLLPLRAFIAARPAAVVQRSSKHDGEFLRSPRVPRILRGLVIVAAGALAATPAPRAGAEIGVIHPDVLRYSAAVREAKGPEVYGALRELWRTWDRADPTHVEEAIGAVARDASTAPPVRAYAELLGAYARRRRGDLDGAIAGVERLGFVSRWITVGPFDNDNKTGFGRAFGPELELSGPIVAGRAFDGKERPVRWRVPPQTHNYGWFDFGDLIRPREQVCAYATTFVRGKPGTRVPRAVSLWMGSAGAFKLFWNAQNVLEDAAYRDIDADRFATTVTLGTGWNRLTLKVCGDKEAPKFALRIGDDRGAPERGVEISSDIETAAQTSSGQPLAEPPSPSSVDEKKVPSTSPQKAPRATAGRLQGPVQDFERLTAGASSSPAVLEAYAHYLAITGGDPAAEHKARDLASRAAEAAPTVRRLLLAGALAEDRNRQREWVERAVSVAREGHRDLEVYLAQAQLARSGTNWRDAVPIYERMLALDPDNVSAILGHVDLYVEAGLKRTALQTLEQAVQRQPFAVALLRVYAIQLRAVARDAEADEVEARYAALRFDDSGYLNQKVELAVARRDSAGAERWLERLLRSEPDSTWARSVAARTYRALGQNDRALAAYQRALRMAPEDVGTLRALSDVHGEDGAREEQLKALHQILAIYPQAKDVREYVEHIEPPRPRADEAYAWAPERFLPMRVTGKQLYPVRTLRDLTVTTVFPNGLSSKFRQVVFQPLTDEAAASSRQYEFAYQGDRQTVQLRAAKVYRSEGGKIDEAIESSDGAANNPALAMYSSQRSFFVNFPRLNAGDVVELRYRVEDVVARNEISDYFGEIEYLQSDEPIASSEYVLITPKARTFHTFATPLRGLTKEVKEDGDRRIFRWASTDVPPISQEPAMPPWSEVRAHVHVSTFKTWDEVGAWYWGLAREQFDVDDEVRRKARAITKGLTDDKSKVRAVYKYATELRYVALEFGIEGIRPRRCALTLARGWGDCKDKATLIVTMLRELAIPATIVLVRTGLRGDVESSPASLAPFDHAIAYVPSLDLYLDGTAENSGSLELPAMDRGALALQINEGKPKLVRLPHGAPEDSAFRRKVEVALNVDGSAQIGLDLQVNGVHAAPLRARYLAEGTRRDRLVRDLAGDFGPIELAVGKAGLDVNDLDDVEQPVRFKARGKAAALARKEGDNLSLPAGPLQRLAADYAALSTRTLDVVLHAMTLRDDEYTVKLPAGAKVLSSPTPQKLDTAFGRFEIEVEQAPGKITVKSSLAFKKTRISPSEYAGWRAFCEAADRAFGQRIVLGK